MRPIRVIYSKGIASIIEFLDDNGVPVRVSVKRDLVHNGVSGFEIDEEELEYAIPHGIPFEEELPDEFVITREMVVTAIRKAGVWTEEDFAKNPNIIRSIVLSSAQEIIHNINVVLSNYQRRLKDG